MAPTIYDDAPGGQPANTEQVEARGVAIDSTGTTDIGTIVSDEAEIKEIRVESTAQDFDFNVEHNGNDTFGGEQSPTAAEETFVPDQNTRSGGVGDATFVLDVSSASASGGATADVQVVTEYRR